MIRDLRKYAQQTTFRLVLGGILLLFIVGDGLIYLFYGRQAATLGLICLVVGLAPLIFIWAAMAVIEWIVKKANEG